MARWLVNRLLTLPLLLVAMYGGAALLVSLAPGEGLESGGRELSPEVLAQKRIAFNYDQPWWRRCWWTWPKRLLWDGDLPAQQYDDWTVVDILRAALPVSLQLGVLALTLAVMIGVGAGVASAVRRGGWLDQIALGLALIGVSLPTFVVGAGLLMVFSLWLRLLPVGGWGWASQTVLPAVTLALPYAAYIARLTRASLLDVYNEDYIRTARAKGLSEVRVLLDHALPNALLPVLSYLGPAAAAIFTGSFVVERIFAVPGMGTHVVESINNRDQTLILSTVMVYGLFLASFNLIVDLLYAVLDPRIRVQR
jgi:oligopeptide transport system permease protein